jgi:8-oxo-dGTP diphosphatase
MSCVDVTLPQGYYTPKPLMLVVAAVFIDSDGRIFLTERPPGKMLAGYWEFPGGKIEPNERPEEALCRELKEELGITTSESCLYPLTFVSHNYDAFHLLMPTYILRQWGGIVTAKEGQRLAWTTMQDIKNYKIIPADAVIIEALRSQL